eukprot:8216667-Alexandrium_andersonii.AAC.1
MEDLHTLVRGMGLVWVHRLRRWYTVSELLTAMGFPITEESQRWCGGVRCQFSRGVTGYPGRTRHSVKAAIGNAMHTNSIGSALLAVLLRHVDSFRNIADGSGEPAPAPTARDGVAAGGCSGCS